MYRGRKTNKTFHRGFWEHKRRSYSATTIASFVPPEVDETARHQFEKVNMKIHQKSRRLLSDFTNDFSRKDMVSLARTYPSIFSEYNELIQAVKSDFRELELFFLQALYLKIKKFDYYQSDDYLKTIIQWLEDKNVALGCEFSKYYLAGLYFYRENGGNQAYYDELISYVQRWHVEHNVSMIRELYFQYERALKDLIEAASEKLRDFILRSSGSYAENIQNIASELLSDSMSQDLNPAWKKHIFYLAKICINSADANIISAAFLGLAQHYDCGMYYYMSIDFQAGIIFELINKFYQTHSLNVRHVISMLEGMVILLEKQPVLLQALCKCIYPVLVELCKTHPLIVLESLSRMAEAGVDSGNIDSLFFKLGCHLTIPHSGQDCFHMLRCLASLSERGLHFYRIANIVEPLWACRNPN